MHRLEVCTSLVLLGILHVSQAMQILSPLLCGLAQDMLNSRCTYNAFISLPSNPQPYLIYAVGCKLILKSA
jgi:hypothetical protein